MFNTYTGSFTRNFPEIIFITNYASNEKLSKYKITYCNETDSPVPNDRGPFASTRQLQNPRCQSKEINRRPPESSKAKEACSRAGVIAKVGRNGMAVS